MRGTQGKNALLCSPLAATHLNADAEKARDESMVGCSQAACTSLFPPSNEHFLHLPFPPSKENRYQNKNDDPKDENQKWSGVNKFPWMDCLPIQTLLLQNMPKTFK